MQKGNPQLLRERVRDHRFLVWYRLLRVVKQGVGFISPSFERANLSRPQFDLLAAIAIDEGQPQQIYARRMTLTKGNITQLLDRLEARGLVLRRKDGRTNYLYLTSAGWEIFNRIVPQHDALLHKLFSRLTQDELAQLTKILRKLGKTIS